MAKEELEVEVEVLGWSSGAQICRQSRSVLYGKWNVDSIPDIPTRIAYSQPHRVALPIP